MKSISKRGKTEAKAKNKVNAVVRADKTGRSKGAGQRLREGGRYHRQMPARKKLFSTEVT